MADEKKEKFTERGMEAWLDEAPTIEDLERKRVLEDLERKRVFREYMAQQIDSAQARIERELLFGGGRGGGKALATANVGNKPPPPFPGTMFPKGPIPITVNEGVYKKLMEYVGRDPWETEHSEIEASKARIREVATSALLSEINDHVVELIEKANEKHISGLSLDREIGSVLTSNIMGTFRDASSVCMTDATAKDLDCVTYGLRNISRVFGVCNREAKYSDLLTRQYVDPGKPREGALIEATQSMSFQLGALYSNLTALQLAVGAATRDAPKVEDTSKVDSSPQDRLSADDAARVYNWRPFSIKTDIQRLE